MVSSGEYTFVSMASNCIQIVHHGQLSKMITSLTKSITGYYGAGVTYDGVSNCVVTNGRPGSIQFYNLATDHCVAAVDVTKQNVIIATGSMSNAANVTKEKFEKLLKIFKGSPVSVSEQDGYDIHFKNEMDSPSSHP